MTILIKFRQKKKKRARRLLCKSVSGKVICPYALPEAPGKADQAVVSPGSGSRQWQTIRFISTRRQDFPGYSRSPCESFPDTDLIPCSVRKPAAQQSMHCRHSIHDRIVFCVHLFKCAFLFRNACRNTVAHIRNQ